MRIAVLGTGAVGRTLGKRLAELGHEVTLGTRDPLATSAREGWLPPTGVGLADFATATADAEVVINATNGRSSLEALGEAGHENLAGKVLIDVSNPLDFSAGFPPTLFVPNSDSLGEQIQRAFPEARVVKSLNTLTASLMVDPSSLGEVSTVFVCGEDDGAKAVVVALLHDLGHADVLDLGGIAAARGMEQWLLLWLRVMGALGGPRFNLRIVRPRD